MSISIHIVHSIVNHLPKNIHKLSNQSNARSPHGIFLNDGLVVIELDLIALKSLGKSIIINVEPSSEDPAFSATISEVDLLVVTNSGEGITCVSSAWEIVDCP
jgi:hypothetical protein